MGNTSNTGITALRQANRWRVESAAEIFRTQASWEWFRRNHHDELIRSGALIPGRGRRGDLVTPEIGDVVVAILRREAGQ